MFTNWVPARVKQLVRGRQPRANRPRPPVFRPRLETLEDRTVPSIIWANRGQASDRFDSVFGAQAGVARAVVDAAITSWERVITNFNGPQDFFPNVIAVEISMATAGTDNGGLAEIIAFAGTAGSGDRPAFGSITLGRGLDLNDPPDGLGDGGGWFLDQTPLDNSEFTGTIVNAFAGDAPETSDVFNQADLFTVVVAELTHVMGLFPSPARFQTPDNGSTLTRLALPDDSTDGGGIGRYFVFDGPSVTHLMTTNNGGPPPDGRDFGQAIHTAGPGGATQPISFTSAFRGNRQLFGADDCGNAAGELGRRYLVSDVMALILQDAYSYTIVRPQRFGTFYALLKDNGTLLVRGGPGSSADNIELSRTGNDLVVRVDVGNDTPGSHLNGDDSNAPAWVSRFRFADVTSITIAAGGGTDTVTLDGAVGNVIPVRFLATDGTTILLGSTLAAHGSVGNLALSTTTTLGIAAGDNLTVNGVAAFRGGTFVAQPIGNSIGRLTATGTVFLNNARLRVSDSFLTLPRIGVPLTIISAASVVGTFSGLRNGDIVVSSSGSGASYLVNYTATTVTLTRVNGPAFQNRAITSPIDEGSEATLTGHITTLLPADTFFLEVNWGDGSRTETVRFGPNASRDVALGHRYLDDGTYTVGLLWRDQRGGFNTGTLTVRVRNVAPVVDAGGVAEVHGGLLTRQVTFTDPGRDRWTAAVDFGDGSAPVVIDLRDSTRFQLRHRYTRPGQYRVTVTVFDDDGGLGTDTFLVIVH